MKKRVRYCLLITYLLITAIHVSAQQLVVSKTRFVGGASNCYTTAQYAIPTSDKGVVFVGYTDCDSSGDIPPNTPDVNGSSFPSNVVIGKLDSNQQLSWIKIYGGTQQDMPYDVIQTTDGGYAILAYTQSNDGNVTGFHGAGDMWLLRLDNMGNLLWEKCYGGPADDEVLSIAITPDNGFIMLGASNGAGGDVPFHYTTSQFVYDWLLIKTDSTGNLQWSKTLGGTDDENYTGSILVADTGYYLAGSSISTDYNCTDTSWHGGGTGHYHFFLLRIDTGGNVQWTKKYGGSNDDVLYNAIWDSRDSSIEMVGQTFSNDYEVSGNKGNGDMLVVKTDRNGQPKWTKTLGDFTEEIATSVAVDAKGNGYLVYGNTQPYNLDTLPASIGKEDAWLFNLDSAGNTLTNKIFGGISYDLPASVFSYNNNYIAVGATSSLSFTEGANIGRNIGNGRDAYISYIDYWAEGVKPITGNMGQLKLYPNPSQGKVRIVLPATDEKGRLIVTSIEGQKEYSQKIKPGTEYLDVDTEGWAKGIYIVQYRDADDGLWTAKLVNN